MEKDKNDRFRREIKIQWIIINTLLVALVLAVGFIVYQDQQKGNLEKDNDHLRLWQDSLNVALRNQCKLDNGCYYLNNAFICVKGSFIVTPKTLEEANGWGAILNISK